jgi:thiazole synthase ThiGH ThiG subunit
LSTPLGALKRTYGLAKIASKVNLKAIAYMKHAVIAGRASFLAGRMMKKAYASASSPMENLI